MSMDEHDDSLACSEYRELARREFVGAGASGIIAMGVAAYFPAWLPRITLADTHASARDVILSIFMRGGADGLTLCVPFGDPDYYASRATIAIPRPDQNIATKSIALDNFFAFPQAMASLMPAYRAKDLLVVHATGQSNSSRSHFDAQRFLEVGRPDDVTLVTGWLGRHLASTPAVRTSAPLRAIGLSSGLKKTLVGAPRTLPIPNPSTFAIGGNVATERARLAFLQDEYRVAPAPIQSAALDASNTIALLDTVGFTTYRPANGAVYPATFFGNALKSVATLIKADIGIEAAQVDISGWDLHAEEGPLAGEMFQVMTDFSNSLAAFYADVIDTVKGPGVTAVAFSEFGRNVRENGSRGTDHGRGTALFAVGKRIAGGRVLVNNWPGLATANLDSGQDLKVTIDYRDILAEIVQKRLQNDDLDFIFPGWTPTMRGVTR
ncbi:MAG: DUF1501 domain-containing protein [bacterium]